MHKRILPVLFAFTFIISSCSRPTSETGNDTTAVSASDTVENGNTDGDIFMSDSLAAMINNDFEWTQPDTVSEYEEDEPMTGPHPSDLNIAGFTDDGKYFIFSQVDPGDGYSGEASGAVFVIDVEKNEWKGRPVRIDLTAEEGIAYDEFLETIKIKRDSTRKKYGIPRDNYYNDEFGFIGVNKNNVVMINKQRYVLELKTPNNLIELRLKGNGKDILLQKDKSIPKSRGNVRRYRLSKAVVSGDKIAVFVEYDGEVITGFENEHYYDRKNIAITGVVK